MEKQKLIIAKHSRLPMITAVCAFFILFFECCIVNIIRGELVVMFRFPLLFGGSPADMIESTVAVCIPVCILIFTLLFAKKNLKMLCWPLVLFIVKVFVQIGYLWIYEGHFPKDSWLDLLVYFSLLLVFALTVFGRIHTRWWLVGICAVFVIMEIVKLFIPAVAYTFVVGSSVYLSTFLSYTLFFVGYGALGLAMERE